jgi:hypothetical protein
MWEDYGFGACSFCHPFEPLKHSFSTVDEIRPQVRMYMMKQEGSGFIVPRWGLSASEFEMEISKHPFKGMDTRLHVQSRSTPY